jgi:hypothetical protein
MMIPKSASFKDWAQSLLIDFPRDNIPILKNEESWKEFGDALVQENSFSRAGAPGTAFYQDKWIWAMDLFRAMANFP